MHCAKASFKNVHYFPRLWWHSEPNLWGVGQERVEPYVRSPSSYIKNRRYAGKAGSQQKCIWYVQIWVVLPKHCLSSVVDTVHQGDRYILRFLVRLRQQFRNVHRGYQFNPSDSIFNQATAPYRKGISQNTNIAGCEVVYVSVCGRAGSNKRASHKQPNQLQWYRAEIRLQKTTGAIEQKTED